MKKNVDCEVFQDQLDTLKQGVLAADGAEQLRLHAEACPDCAMLLRMHEHLASASLEQLEAAVPDVWVGSMWGQVEAEIATRESRRGGRLGGWQGSGWLVPAMAAASVLLFISTGFLLGERARLRDREGALARLVAEHETRLAELEVRTSSGAIARATGFAGRRAWEHKLSRRESVSVAELGDMLGSLPSGVTLVDASGVEALLNSVPFWTTATWRAALDQIRAEDGVQAGELLRVLDALDVDPEMSIPTARILALSRGSVRTDRS